MSLLFRCRFKLYQVTPTNEDHLRILADLDDHQVEYGVDFWLHGIRLGERAEILVEPQRQENFENLMKKYGIPYVVAIKDLQR